MGGCASASPSRHLWRTSSRVRPPSRARWRRGDSLFLVLFLAQLGVVLFFSARVDRLAPGTATLLFIAYAALTGITFSVILLAYTGASMANTFMVTAGMFGALAVYGTTTSRSLAGVGQFLFMGLIGLVLASVVGMFWQNDALQFLISVVGVLVFTGLTAWDAQRLKQMATQIPEDKLGSYAILGALSLYLNFINLFLFLLRFMGGRRDYGRQAADKGPSASLAPSAAGSTYREYASPAAFGRRLASGPFSAPWLPARRVGSWPFLVAWLAHYLQGFSCLHALISQVWPTSPPSQPGKGQSATILGSTTTSMNTSKRGMVSKFSNL